MNTSLVERLIGPGYSGFRLFRGAPNGNAFVARDKTDGKKVFVKLVDGTRYRRELHVFALRQKTNIVTPIDTIYADSQHCALIYPWFSAGSLRKWIHRRRLWSGERVVRLADDLLLALRDLHARGMIHGDLKPENVLVERDAEDLRFHLSDFGSSAYFQELLQSRWRAATPAYEAPESVDGRPSPRSDLFALGAVLYEVLTGQPPHRGMPNAIYRHSRHEIPSLQQIEHPRLRALLSLLLQNDADMRPDHAGEARALLSGELPSLPALLPKTKQPVLSHLAKQDVQVGDARYDHVVSSASGRHVVFHARGRLSLYHWSGQHIGTLTCSNVQPTWQGERLWYVQGSDLWVWDVGKGQMYPTISLRNIPDAFSVNRDHAAWLYRDAVFCKALDGGRQVSRRLKSYLTTKCLAISDTRCYVAAGISANTLQCFDSNLSECWTKSFDGLIQGLQSGFEGQALVILRELAGAGSLVVLDVLNGSIRHRLYLDPETRHAALTPSGCIAWLASGLVRTYTLRNPGPDLSAMAGHVPHDYGRVRASGHK